MEGNREVALITVREAADLEGVERREIYRRCKPDYPTPIIWNNGPRGRLVDLRSLSPSAHTEWLTRQLNSIADPPRYKFTPAELAVLSIPESQKDTVARRLRVVHQCNTDHRLLGYRRRGNYLKELANRESCSVRTLNRWNSAYKKEGLAGLQDTRPGSAPSGPRSLDVWMRTWVERDWIWAKLTKTQCYRSLVKKIKRVNSLGGRYSMPSKSSVFRFIGSLSPILQAYRFGPTAIKRTFGRYYSILGDRALVLGEWREMQGRFCG